MMWGWNRMGYGWMGWSIGMIIMFAVLAGVAAFVIWAVTSLTTHRTEASEPDDILRQRLAKGELSREEYERLRTVLHDQA